MIRAKPCPVCGGYPAVMANDEKKYVIAVCSGCDYETNPCIVPEEYLLDAAVAQVIYEWENNRGGMEDEF